MQEDKKFNFQIKGIEILDTSIVKPEHKIDDDTVFGFQLEAEHSIHKQNELIIVSCNVKVTDNENKLKLGHVNASCLYYVENLGDFFDESSNALQLPDGIVTMLNSISISTIRGVMYGIFRGTYLDGAILPIINPKIDSKNKK